MTRLLALLVLSVWFHATAFAGQLPDYVRYAEDEKSTRLEVAIRKFTLASGQTVDLIGAIHIADAAYYQELNERFAAYDSVLFELVGDPESLKQPSGSGLSSFQQSIGEYLKLTFQLNGIDYTGKNMVHADATAEEFAKMQQERGETMMNLFARAMQAQMAPANRAAARELDTFQLIRILMSKDSATEFKKALAKTMDQFESVAVAVEGKQGSAILSGRNDVAMKKLQEVLAAPKQRHVAVFYGGAHMPGIEASLLKDMKAQPTGEEWLPAWTMPKAPPP